MQQYSGSDQTVWSNSVTVNYTGDSDISLTHITGTPNTQIRLDMTANTYRSYEFYIGAKNLYSTALSPRVKVAFVCPASGGVTAIPPAASLTKRIDIGAVSYASEAGWSTWTETVHIPNCGFLKYGFTADSTNTPLITYPRPGFSTTTYCPGYLARCREVRVDTSKER